MLSYECCLYACMSKSRQSKPPKPTDAELAILRVLWQRGDSTVRDVWEELNPRQHTGYTTVLKTMQIMAEKGLLARSEGQTQRQVLGHLLERLFSGSAPKLVMQALAAKKATPAELAEIRKLLDDMEGGPR